MPSFKQSAPLRVVATALAAGALMLMPTVVAAQQAPAGAPPKAAPKKQPPGQQPAQQPAQQQPAQQPAQQQAAPSVVQVKSEASQTDWTKACGKDPSNSKDICYTTRDFVSDQNVPVIAVAVYDVKGEPNKMVRFLLPLQLLLPPGLRVGFDQSQPLEGRYAICFPNGCFAEVPMKEADIAAMKKAANLNVSVQNQMGTVVTFQVPLAGFGQAFDGAPIDPEKLKQQQEMQKLLQEKGQEEMQKRSGGAPPKQ
jgi:invasion protein IalB